MDKKRKKGQKKVIHTPPIPRRRKHKRKAYHKHKIHHDPILFTKSLLSKISTTFIVAFVLSFLYNFYFKRTAIYYKYFRISEVYFGSLPFSNLSTIIYFLLFILLFVGIVILGRRLCHLDLCRQKKNERLTYAFATSGFLLSNIFIKLWIGNNYEVALEKIGFIRVINNGTIFLAIIFLIMTIFGYAFKRKE